VPTKISAKLRTVSDESAVTAREPSTPRPSEPPRLRLVQGEGQGRAVQLNDRSDLASVLVGTAADLLLKRITSVRAHAIEQKVERLMSLFDRVDSEPMLKRMLRRELNDLEALVRESQGHRRR
jgi:hypothetical protein